MRVFLLAVLLMGAWGMAQQQEPSLADLSKQAREKKAKTQKAARLITNADLKKFQNAPVSVSTKPAEPVVDQSSAKPGTGADQTQTAQDPKKKLEEWATKFRVAVFEYKSLVDRGVYLQLRMNDRTNAYYGAADDATRGMYAGQLEQVTKDIEENRAAIANAEKAIDDLKTAAREDGIEEADIAAMVGNLPTPVEDLGQAPAPEATETNP